MHKHLIPNSYFVPKGGVRLLSPQHWAKSQQGKLKISTGETTNSKECKLHWGEDAKYTLTVPLDRQSNVATFELAPGYRSYDIYCQQAAINVRDKDENPEKSPFTPSDDEEGELYAQMTISTKRDWSSPNGAKEADFNMNGPSAHKLRHYHNPNLDVISSDARDFLHLHYKLGHIPFSKLREMAKQGLIPSKYAKCETPVCSACLYAKQTRQAWRSKPMHQYHCTKVLEPGEVVSVD